MLATALFQNNYFNSSLGKRVRELNGHSSFIQYFSYKLQDTLSCYDINDKPCASPEPLRSHALLIRKGNWPM
jgi:hypothetical protein